jgi:glyceraldehyde-3-phosphate dehydrogenase (NADP+)
MKMLIGGMWVSTKEDIKVHDPFDGSVIDTVPRASAEDVKRAIDFAEKGYETSRRLPVHKRISILQKAAAIVRDRQEEFAKVIAREGSKTIREARKEASRCVDTLSISAEEARRVVGETIPFDSRTGSENRFGYYTRFPIGVIAAITPFNDPLNLVAHKIGPAIAGGNSVVLKPATVTPLSALKLAEALMEAELPGNILNVVTGYGHEIGDALVTDPRIRMISFTGGGEAGLAITRKAGLKKIGMELGSNSPVIVLADSDFLPAVENCVSGAFWAAGQNCIGVQRIYIEEAIFQKFAEKFAEVTKSYRIGNKMDEKTDMGPMIEEKEAIRVEQWIREAVEGGAKVLAGGKRKGTLVEPTVLVNTPRGAKLDCQEVFGPVVSLYPVKDLDEGIRRSNEMNFGLHAAIFTRDLGKAFKAIRELDCGGVMVNDSTDYRIDMMPFGGIKMSGLGREGIKFALLEMTEPKVVCFNL